MKGLQKRNIGTHHLGSRGYGGKRSKWAKEDAEAASLGIPDPLAEFTVPQERDVLRARHRWDPVKKVFEKNAVMTEFIRLLVILVSDQFDCTLVIFVNCWKYALEAIIKWLLLYFLVHDNCLLFML